MCELIPMRCSECIGRSDDESDTDDARMCQAAASRRVYLSDRFRPAGRPEVATVQHPWRDGTLRLVITSLAFMQSLAAGGPGTRLRLRLTDKRVASFSMRMPSSGRLEPVSFES